MMVRVLRILILFFVIPSKVKRWVHQRQNTKKSPQVEIYDGDEETILRALQIRALAYRAAEIDLQNFRVREMPAGGSNELTAEKRSEHNAFLERLAHAKERFDFVYDLAVRRGYRIRHREHTVAHHIHLAEAAS
ncbi:MAG TPA: hypothetical protein VJB56_00975 [Candidatus Paceibacterota bacterium]